MDQILQLVLNNGVPRGSERPKWINFSNWCRTMGGQGFRGVEMDQILQLVLNNGGSRGQRASIERAREI